MRAVLQRVSSACVRVGQRTVGRIGLGLVVLVGVARDDTDADVRYLANKIRALRLFEGDEGKSMDCAVGDVGGAVLVVSQFTLLGDVRRGRRPSFDRAASPDRAQPLYDALVRELRSTGLTVETGEFQTTMQVELVNDGPVTLVVDSTRQDT